MNCPICDALSVETKSYEIHGKMMTMIFCNLCKRGSFLRPTIEEAIKDMKENHDLEEKLKNL